jgi:hypothetical protein
MSLTKLSLGGNNLYMTSLFPTRESLVSDILAGDGNIKKLFLWCNVKYSSIPTYYSTVFLVVAYKFKYK